MANSFIGVNRLNAASLALVPNSKLVRENLDELVHLVDRLTLLVDRLALLVALLALFTLAPVA